MLQAIFNSYVEIQEFINDNTFIGIPLDILAHFFVSAILSIFLLALRIRFSITFCIILFIAIIKEILDWHRQVNPDFFESLKDIVITLIYPVIIYKINERKNKKKLKKN